MKGNYGRLAVLLACAISPAVCETTYWINQFPLYSSMASCAMAPVSAVVRGMSAGCGDGGAYTSYDCFCSERSTQMADLIASSVSSNCHGTLSDIVTALAVYQSYCELGNTVTVTASASSSSTTSSSSSSSSTTSASPITITVTSAAPTSTPTDATAEHASAAPASATLSPGAKAGIAIGVIAILVALAGLAAFIYYRRRSLSNPSPPRDGDPFTLIDTRPSTSQPHSEAPIPMSAHETGREWKQMHKSPSPPYVVSVSEKSVAQPVLVTQNLVPNAYGIDGMGVHEMSPVSAVTPRQPRHELS